VATLNTESLEAADRLGWLLDRSPDQLLAAHPTVASAIRLLNFLEGRQYLKAGSDALAAHLGQHLNSVFTLCRWLERAGYISSFREESAGKGGKMIYEYCFVRQSRKSFKPAKKRAIQQPKRNNNRQKK
jgi:hypothetical protein